ncbi:MAG: hypothetical protein IPK60_23230 [Sandaracinaceae bacterium]|jgi:hypothetical protein|nr:hypothetical protein [Sandaracinaceae bacterium]
MPLRFTASPVVLAALCAIPLFGCSLLVTPDETALPNENAVDLGRDPIDAGGLDAGENIDLGVGFDAGNLDANVLPDIGVPEDMGPCGAAGCIISASNVSDDLWDHATHDLNVRGGGVTRINTDTCRLGSTDGMIVTQEGGGTVCVIQVNALTVADESSLSVRGPIPLIIMATGRVQIDGEIDASAHGDEPGAGGGAGGTIDVIDGTGRNPGAAGEHIDEYDDGGGGGGGLCGSGGNGGSGGDASGGDGGDSESAWTIEPLAGGSGGGRGRGLVDGRDTNAGLGGAGGGALQISSLTEIIVNGRIFTGGGGGLGGTRELGDGTNYGSGGGGGSGGALLLEAPAVSFGAAARLGLGGGGGGAASTNTANGGDGNDGAVGPMASLGGGGMVVGANGGDGAHGATIDGATAVDRPSSTNGAGGGGGSGCMVVRNASGTLTSSSFVDPTGSVQVLPMHTR